MFVFIGKAFLPLVQPLGFSLLCWMGAVLCLWRGAQRAGRMLALAGIVIVLISACPVTGGWLLGHLEAAYPANTVEATPAADAIVVLGGITAPAIPPRTETDVTGAFDRLLHGMRLWRAGKAEYIVLSGGVMPGLTGSDVPESERMRRLALEYGVPAKALLLESRSRTTHENAVYTRALLAEHGVERALLVTSAAHMWRAVGCFRAAGVDVIPAPTDVRIVPMPWQPGTLLPSLDGLDFTTRAAKEYIGWWVYRFRGWVR